VERWDKRKTAIVFQSIMSLQALGLAALTFSGRVQIWHIGVLALLFGLASAVEITARQAMLVELCGREALPSAIALHSMVFNIGRVIGPLLASWLLTSTGTEGSVFLANGVSYLFVIAGLFMIQTRYRVPRAAGTTKSLGTEFHEGMGYIRKNTLVATIILMAAIVGFFGFPLVQQLPALARDVLRTASDTEASVAARTSLLYAAQGAGPLTAAVLAAYMSSSKNRGRMVLFGQMAFIFPLIALGYVPNLNVSLLLLVLIGWGTVTQLVSMNTLVQLDVPNALRGRVFSVYLWALQGVAPFGSLLIGWLAQNWGVPLAALAGGLVSLVSIGVLHLVSPDVRRASP
jgi:MFS family permease